MADEGGTLIYKCRRCLKMDDHLHVPDVHRSTLYAVRGIPYSDDGCGALIIRTHLCEDGHIGVLDLLGGEYDIPKRGYVEDTKE